MSEWIRNIVFVSGLPISGLKDIVLQVFVLYLWSGSGLLIRTTYTKQNTQYWRTYGQHASESKDTSKPCSLLLLQGKDGNIQINELMTVTNYVCNGFQRYGNFINQTMDTPHEIYSWTFYSVCQLDAVFKTKWILNFFFQLTCLLSSHNFNYIVHFYVLQITTKNANSI